MFNLQANIIPHEARCLSLQVGDCLVNPSKLCKAGGSQDSILVLLFDQLLSAIKHRTHLIGEDHRVESDVGGRILLQPVVVCHKVGIVGDPETESVVLGCVPHNPNDGDPGGQEAAKRHFQGMGGHLLVKSKSEKKASGDVDTLQKRAWVSSIVKF